MLLIYLVVLSPIIGGVISESNFSLEKLPFNLGVLYKDIYSWKFSDNLTFEKITKSKNNIALKIEIAFNKFKNETEDPYPLLPKAVRSIPKFQKIENAKDFIDKTFEVVRKLNASDVQSYKVFLLNVTFEKTMKIQEDILNKNLVELVESEITPFLRTNSSQCSMKAVAKSQISSLIQLDSLYYNLKSEFVSQFAFHLQDFIINQERSLSLHKNQAHVESSLKSIESSAKSVEKTENPFSVCEKKSFTKGVTYDQFVRVVQGYLINRQDISSDGTCGMNCDTYQNVVKKRCLSNNCDDPCNGRILRCNNVGHVHGDSVSVCGSGDKSKRFNGFSYNEYSFGDSTTCASRKTLQSYRAKWYNLFRRCHYCFCYCDDEKDPLSDRYISLKSVTSDVTQNMVLTGIKFVKKNKVFHLQIQQGRLMPFATIDKNSVGWKIVENVNVTTSKDNIDFYTINDDKGAINLDFVKSSIETEVMTGVKIDVVENHLTIGITLTKFDWKTGILSNSSRYLKVLKSNNSRKEIQNTSLKSPLKSNKDNLKVISSNGDYVKFKPTSKLHDAGQSTVPFIDIQPLETYPAAPLSGVGLSLKGENGFGGFIAPVIFT